MLYIGTFCNSKSWEVDVNPNYASQLIVTARISADLHMSMSRDCAEALAQRILAALEDHDRSEVDAMLSKLGGEK